MEAPIGKQFFNEFKFFVILAEKLGMLPMFTWLTTYKIKRERGWSSHFSRFSLLVYYILKIRFHYQTISEHYNIDILKNLKLYIISFPAHCVLSGLCVYYFQAHKDMFIEVINLFLKFDKDVKSVYNLTPKLFRLKNLTWIWIGSIFLLVITSAKYYFDICLIWDSLIKITYINMMTYLLKMLEIRILMLNQLVTTHEKRKDGSSMCCENDIGTLLRLHSDLLIVAKTINNYFSSFVFVYGTHKFLRILTSMLLCFNTFETESWMNFIGFHIANNISFFYFLKCCNNFNENIWKTHRYFCRFTCKNKTCNRLVSISTFIKTTIKRI